jgi:hypothetical protein
VAGNNLVAADSKLTAVDIVLEYSIAIHPFHQGSTFALALISDFIIFTLNSSPF